MSMLTAEEAILRTASKPGDTTDNVTTASKDNTASSEEERWQVQGGDALAAILGYR